MRKAKVMVLMLRVVRGTRRPNHLLPPINNITNAPLFPKPSVYEEFALKPNKSDSVDKMALNYKRVQFTQVGEQHNLSLHEHLGE